MTSNLLIVLTGKTASGKDTVMAQLLFRIPNLKRVITTTSRTPRNGEQNGVDYNFISEADFRQKIQKEDFIEYVEYAGNLYGTEKSQLINGENYDLIWRIDPSMAGQVRLLIDNFFKKVLVIYLTVDDEVVLERLKKRSLSQEEIEKRMQDDKRFWEQFKGNYDFIVENVPGKLNETLDEILKIIEKHHSTSSCHSMLDRVRVRRTTESI